MLKSFFLELFAYNHHFNKKFLDRFISAVPAPSERSVQLFNHMLNAHQVWNSRILDLKPLPGVWDIREMDLLPAIEDENDRHSIQIVNHMELDEDVHYVNTKGEGFTKKLQDILFHIINHSTYHRGQIAADWRRSGIEPVASDFIFFKK